jgi:integrase
MAKAVECLTVPKIKKLTDPGRHLDGGNLYFKIRDNGAKGWVLYAKFQKRIIELGLGAYPDVSLAEAREKAAEGNALMREGKNPKEVWAARRRGTGAPTFAVVAQQWFDSMSPTWKSARYREQVKADLFEHCANLAGMPVDKITTDDVLVTLKARGGVKSSKLHLYIKQVLDAARARGYVPSTTYNPATWRGHLDKVLAPPPKAVNHPAMPYSDVPAFLERLRGMRQDSEGNIRIDAYGLEFLVLTGVRSSEAREAQWPEINLETRTWTIPAERMKGGEKHAVPLSAGALAILAEMRKVKTGDCIFPGFKLGQPLTSKSFERLLKRMGYRVTTHGFRASLRMWCKANRIPFEVAEPMLAHSFGDKTAKAYDREAPLEQMAEAFAAWNAYCQPKPDNVVTLRTT